MATRYLIIVESPNKIKTIRNILNGTEYTNAVVMASVGHICEIANSKKSYYNTGIYPDKDFKADYVVSEDKKEIVQKLKDQAELADVVYLCSDPDREGESIAWELQKFVKIDKNKCRRASFHEITAKAVLDALNNYSKLDNDLVDSADTRRKTDKLLGFRLSSKVRREVKAKSMGRCQGAALKMVVNREREIRDFKSETYYDIFLHFSKNYNQYKAKYVGTTTKPCKRLTDKAEVSDILSFCTNKKYVVKNVSSKDKLSNPKPPFTTSSFQQEVSTKLGISIKSAMDYAQRLFEGIDVNGEHIALITYIRTDCAELSKEFVPILEDFIKANYGKEYYAHIRKVKKSENAQEGHEAIRPVDLSMTPDKLSKYIYDKNLLKVYDIIYKRTIATSMASSITSETTYEITCEDKYQFNFISNELKFDGYKKVYNYKDDTDEEGVSKDTFKKGEVLQNTNLECVEKQTQPPSRYKEASFVKELESNGIGRPSTFEKILSTILDKSRNYCVLEDKEVVPTELGMKLIDYTDKSFPQLINLEYTSKLEKDLDLIAKGKLKEIAFLQEFLDNLEQTIKDAPKVAQKPLKQQIDTDKVCPVCGAKMYLRKSSYGEFYGCSTYPKCKGILKKENEELNK